METTVARPLSQSPAPAPLAHSFVRFYTVLFPCCRATANKYARSGKLKTFMLGSRRMVTDKEARAFVERMAAAGAGNVPPEVSAQKSRAGKLGKAKQIAARKAQASAA